MELEKCPLCENGIQHFKPTDWTQPNGLIMAQIHPDFGVDRLGVVRYMGLAMKSPAKVYQRNDPAKTNIEKIPNTKFIGLTFQQILKTKPAGTFTYNFEAQQLPSVLALNKACTAHKAKNTNKDVENETTPSKRAAKPVATRRAKKKKAPAPASPPRRHVDKKL